MEVGIRSPIHRENWTMINDQTFFKYVALKKETKIFKLSSTPTKMAGCLKLFLISGELISVRTRVNCEY